MELVTTRILVSHQIVGETELINLNTRNRRLIKKLDGVKNFTLEVTNLCTIYIQIQTVPIRNQWVSALPLQIIKKPVINER